MRAVRARAQLRVGLRSDVKWVHVSWQFDVLDQVAVWRHAGEHEPRIRNLLAIRVVDFVAVAVALGDASLPIQLTNDRAIGEVGRVQAEAHRSAEVAAGDDLNLFSHRGDDREVGVRVELGG